MEKSLTALLALVILAGCSLPHQARLGESIITHRRLVDRPFVEIGLVHAETWGPTLFWSASTAGLRKTVTRVLVAEAKKHGADAVVDLDVRVENHYSLIIPIPFPAIVGWEECHATGTAIRFTR